MLGLLLHAGPPSLLAASPLPSAAALCPSVPLSAVSCLFLAESSSHCPLSGSLPAHFQVHLARRARPSLPPVALSRFWIVSLNTLSPLVPPCLSPASILYERPTSWADFLGLSVALFSVLYLVFSPTCWLPPWAVPVLAFRLPFLFQLLRLFRCSYRASFSFRSLAPAVLVAIEVGDLFLPFFPTWFLGRVLLSQPLLSLLLFLPVLEHGGWCAH